MILKDIPGYENYKVSDCGKVFSKKRTTTKGGPLKQWIHNKRYYVVNLTKEGVKKKYLVHRLVALAFIENTENKETVNHKDGNKLNNHVSNLEWATQLENSEHALETGLTKQEAVTAINVATGEEMQFKSQIEAVRVLGVKHFSLRRVLNGQRKTTKGYIFKRKEG